MENWYKTVFTVFSSAFSRWQRRQLIIAFNVFKNQMFWQFLFVLFPTGVTLMSPFGFIRIKIARLFPIRAANGWRHSGWKSNPKMNDYRFQSLSNLVGRQAFILFRWINRCQRQTKLLTLQYTKLVLLFFFLIIILFSTCCEVRTQRCVVFRLQSFAFPVRCRLLHPRRINLLPFDEWKQPHS